MNESFNKAVLHTSAPTSPNRPDQRLQSKLSHLAQLALTAVGGTACIIEWHSDEARGVLHLPPDRRWQPALTALLGEVHRASSDPLAESQTIQLDSARLGSLLGVQIANGIHYQAAAYSSREESSAVLAVILGAAGRASSELAAAAAMTANAALQAIAAEEIQTSREFWRKRAVESGQRAASVKSKLSVHDAESQRIQRASKAIAKLPARNRFTRLGEIIARFGDFDAWLIAAPDDSEFRVLAASGVFAPKQPLGSDSAIAESARLKQSMIREPGAKARTSYREDELFARFACYACFPFAAGVIALASKKAISRDELALLERLIEATQPVVRNWLAGEEIQRLEELVKNLGRRMFAAAEVERARIARDLHDHQAQLLAAARIALEAGPDEARDILKQVEDALRLRVRELRPATLGRAKLDEALAYELSRLKEAGMKARLVNASRMRRLTRPVQQLCYQTAREALSNIVRHSGAKHVEIGLEKRARRVRLTITDDGRGFDAKGALKPSTRQHNGRGIGLHGLAERLELMGAKLMIESRPGRTQVVADIPETV